MSLHIVNLILHFTLNVFLTSMCFVQIDLIWHFNSKSCFIITDNGSTSYIFSRSAECFLLSNLRWIYIDHRLQIMCTKLAFSSLNYSIYQLIGFTFLVLGFICYQSLQENCHLLNGNFIHLLINLSHFLKNSLPNLINLSHFFT